EHPGVQIISRDRGGDYAKGAKEGAPDAKQVADRWHLLKNLSETMQSYFQGKQQELKAAMKEQKAPSLSKEQRLPVIPWHIGRTKREEEKSQQFHQERLERYRQIHDLYTKSVDVANIARQLGLSRQS